MKGNERDLVRSLERGLAPVYWLSSDEILLRNEAQTTIEAKAKTEGFDSRRVLFADESRALQELSELAQTLSLFAERELILLHLNKPKVSKEQSAALIQYLDTAPTDQCLIIVSPKLESACLRSKLLKRVETECQLIVIWPPHRNQFSGWLQTRAKTYGLSFTADAVALLAEYYEGDLLGADQTLQLLLLYYGNSANLSKEQVATCANEQPRYDLFEFADTVLSGDTPKALKQLSLLQEQDIAPNLLLWVIAKDIRTLYQHRANLKAATQAAVSFKQLGIWQKRQGLFTQALKRLSLKSLHELLDLLYACDKAVKGASSYSINTLITQLIVKMSGQTALENLTQGSTG